ncbi:MAG: hypothetical protein AAB425_04155, partial [Bdellovibrionota bacterium]
MSDRKKRARSGLGPILVGSEMVGTRAESVARWSTAFGRRFKSSIEYVHVEDIGLYLSDSDLFRPLVAKHLERRNAKNRGVQTHLLEGNPAAEIL